MKTVQTLNVVASGSGKSIFWSNGMNERIRELAKESGLIQYDSDGKMEDIEKFAKLIVRECCEVLEQTEDALDRQKWPTPRGCVEYIKDYFGVDE